MANLSLAMVTGVTKQRGGREARAGSRQGTRDGAALLTQRAVLVNGDGWLGRAGVLHPRFCSAPQEHPPSLCPPQGGTWKDVVPRDADTPPGCGPRGRAASSARLAGTAPRVPKLAASGQAGRARWAQCGPSGPTTRAACSHLNSALLGTWAGVHAHLGPGGPQLDALLSPLIPPPAQPCVSCESPHGAQPGSIDPGPGAICSAALWPCLLYPGLHGDVMFGSAPPVTV